MWVFILLMLFTFTAADGQTDKDEFGTVLFNVPFGSGQLKVWQLTAKRGRYYVSPIAELLSDTAYCENNPITGEVEMRFDVILWSLNVREAVHRYIIANDNSDVSIDDIEPIPMESIRLVWRDTDRPLKDVYRLSQTWNTNTRLRSKVSFFVLCKTMKDCEVLKQYLQDEPKIVDGFEIQYVVEAQKSYRKTINVQGKHVWQGRLFTQLRKQLPMSATVYINSDDIRMILSETVRSVVATAVADADYETEDDSSVTDAVNSLLTRNKVSSRQFTTRMWNSTFWDPLRTRPDQVNEKLNRLFSEDASNSSLLILTERNDTNQESADVRVADDVMELLISDFKYHSVSESSNSSKIPADDVNRMLRQRDMKSEWTGKRFEVKLMELYRLNVGTLNTTTAITRGSVQIRRYGTVRHIRVNVRPVYNQTDALTLELVDKHLNQRLELHSRNIMERLDDHDEKIAEQLRAFNNNVTERFDTLLNQSIAKEYLAATRNFSESRSIDLRKHKAAFAYCNSDGRFCMRLVNGSKTTRAAYGRVEVFHSGKIGTICDDYWDHREAEVVCRMLGYRGIAIARHAAYFGQGTGPIWLDDMRCSGSEASITDCTHLGWGKHTCDHREDAGVQCYQA